MNWKQEDGYITTGDALKASVKRCLDKYVVRVGGLSAHWTFDTEGEAKQFGEEQLQIAKRAVILSLIVEDRGSYKFGNFIEIFGGYEGADEWTVYLAEEEVFEGTLEECKNYIAECF